MGGKVNGDQAVGGGCCGLTSGTLGWAGLGSGQPLPPWRRPATSLPAPFLGSLKVQVEDALRSAHFTTRVHTFTTIATLRQQVVCTLLLGQPLDLAGGGGRIAVGDKMEQDATGWLDWELSHRAGPPFCSLDHLPSRSFRTTSFTPESSAGSSGSACVWTTGHLARMGSGRMEMWPFSTC